MPRKRRPDQGPPVPRIRSACVYCKVKRLKCSDIRPCTHCVSANIYCSPAESAKRQKASEQGLPLPPSDVGSSKVKPTELVPYNQQETIHPPSQSSLESHSSAVGIRCESIDFDKSSSQVLNDEVTIHELTASYESIVATSISAEERKVMDTFLENPIFLSRPATPVSSILDTNPLYRELWYHYTEVLSSLHTSHDRTTNPILRVLSPVALSSEPLLCVLLASSLENYRSLRGQEPDEEMLTTLINAAVVGVQKDLGNSAMGHIQDTTLATVIALCDFEVVARKRATTSSWRVHLHGAKKMIDMRGGPYHEYVSSEFNRFLLKWLAYFDVMSAMTSTENLAEPLFDGLYWTRDAAVSSTREDDFRLDPYMGFLQDVVPYFVQIGRLTAVKAALDKDGNLRTAQQLYTQCRRIEHGLNATLGMIPGHAWIAPQKLVMLINCHDAFVHSTLIHLYRRIEGLTTSSVDVQRAVTTGLDHIARSCQNDATEIDSSLLFPLFTFGCEAITEQHRQYVLDRLKALGALGLGNVDRALEVLLLVWTTMESHPEAQIQWTEILYLFKWEVNLA